MKWLSEKKTVFQKHSLEAFEIVIYLLVLIVSFFIIYNGNGEWEKGYEAKFNIIKLFFSIPVILFLYYKNEKIENFYIKFCIKIIIITMIIPISAIYSILNYPTFQYLWMMFEILLIIELMNGYKLIGKNVNFAKIKKMYSKINFNFTSKLIYYACWFNTIIVMIMCIKYNGIPSLTAFNISKVYDIREKFYLPKYISYLYDFETKFILIFLTGFYLYKKKYKMAIVTTLIQILFFLLKGDKIVMFGSILVIMIYFIFTLFHYEKINEYLFFTVICTFTAFILLAFIHIDIPLGMVIRRMLLLPANMKFKYFDFFSQNAHVGIVGTVLNAIVKMNNPYVEIPYENLIGDIYYGYPNMFANTGFLIEGFVRWGYIGLLIIPVIFSSVMLILQHGVKNNNLIFMITISVVPILNLNDTYLISSATFGALAFLCMISVFFKIDKLDVKKKE